MLNIEFSLKNGLTHAARGIVYLFGFAVIVINTVLMPESAREEAVGKVNPPTTYPFFVGMWILSTPVLVALYHTLKLIDLVDKNNIFSNAAVIHLRTLKLCAAVFGSLVMLSALTMVIITRTYYPTEDAPPILMIGSIVAFVSSIFATFVAVLQRLLQEVIEMKKENDLIV